MLHFHLHRSFTQHDTHGFQKDTENIQFSFSFFSSFSFEYLGLGGCIMLVAICYGDAKGLAELMRQDPGFKVNMGLGGPYCTPLALIAVNPA